MKNLLLCLGLLALCSCKTPPSFQGVNLEDGKPGFLMDCHEMGEVECLTYAHRECKNGYKFLHRNVANHSNFLLISCQ